MREPTVTITTLGYYMLWWLILPRFDWVEDAHKAGWVCLEKINIGIGGLSKVGGPR